MPPILRLADGPDSRCVPAPFVGKFATRRMRPGSSGEPAPVATGLPELVNCPRADFAAMESA